MPDFGLSGGGGGGATTAPSNPKPYIWLPNGWNQPTGAGGWLAAKAAQAGTVALVGDSIMQGTAQNTNILTKRLGRLLLNYLNATIGGSKVAEYFPVADDLSKVATWTGNGAAYPWSLGNGSGQSFVNDGYEVAVQSTQVAAAGTTIYNFSGGTGVDFFAWTEADIIIRDLVAGTLHYNIDGGTDQTFTLLGDGAVKRIQVPTQANTTHVVNIGGQSVASSVQILGITLYYGSRAASGWTLANHVCGGQSAGNLSGVTGVANAYKAARSAVGPIGAPDLMIWGLGVNDTLTETAITDGATWMIEAGRAANPNMSVIVMAMANFSTSLSDTGAMFATSNQSAWYRMIASSFRMAESNGYAFMNIHNRWAAAPVAKGFVTAGSGSGQPHPNDAGHADMAAAIESIL